MKAQGWPKWPVFGAAEERALLRALRSGKWGRLHGDEVATFEQRFAKAHDCKHAIAVVNGTVSLRVALMAAGIQADDEVIVPPYTFFSTASAVIEANAIPVFADVELDTFNIDPKAVEALITPRTKAIIPVHFAGQFADMNALLKLARKHKLTVIEDAAHAHGALFEGRGAGSIGHFGSFSFQSSKNLTSGEGGLITTNDDEMAEACRSIQSCGRVPGGLWYEHHVMSGNYRLGEFQGAILNAQLDRLEAQTIRRDANGRRLAGRLEKLPGIYPQRRTAETTRHAYHLFMMRVVENEFGASREKILKALQAEGVACSGGYVVSLPRQPMFLHKAFGPYLPKSRAKLKYAKANVPNSDRLCKETIWIEQSVLLGTARQMDRIAQIVEGVRG